MALKENNTYIFLEKDENVLAYCPTCKIPVFKGADRTAVEMRVLKSRVIEHQEWHSVDIIFPKRKNGEIVSGDIFIAPKQFPAKLGRGEGQI